MTININGTTGISGVDGSAGTPAIQGSDTNTGVFFGTNTIDLSTDGTSRLSIGADGDLNVDSGTLFVDASTNRVGIGTTSPSELLHLSGGAIRVDGTFAVNATSALGLDQVATSTSAIRAWGASGTVATLTFNTGSGGTGDTEKMRIDNLGRVLIGEQASAGTQDAMLQVGGGNGSTTFSAVAIISGNDEVAGHIMLESSASNSVGFAADPDNQRGSTDMRFTVDGTERMRINPNGCFKASKTGSYNSSTNQEHEFNNQTIGVWNVRLRHTASSDPRGILLQYTGAAPNDSTAEFIQAQDSSALRMTLRSNGGIANFQSNDANLCDEREKKNIVALDSTWDCLKHWEIKKFHYNEDADTDDKRYGVIAQQVDDHCPEVITDWVKQKAEDAVLDDDGNVVTPAKEEIIRMGVKEQQMYWMAIRALQEAQIRIETLEARLSVLEGGAN